MNMTPTPDPPPAAPLTAEQIAAKKDEWQALAQQSSERADAANALVEGRLGADCYDDYFFSAKLVLWVYEQHQENAVLRDRLARAEALQRDVWTAYCHEVAWHDRDEQLEERVCAARATPTDGEARWHGLTGAEIEGMQRRRGTFYYVDWEWISHFDPDEPDAVVEPGYKLFHVYESKPMRMGSPVAHFKDEGEANADSDRRNAALAAAPPPASE